MNVVVLEVDPENRRLSLGHKQLEENPWDVFETIFTMDLVHEGTVLKIGEKRRDYRFVLWCGGFLPEQTYGKRRWQIIESWRKGRLQSNWIQQRTT